jgi:transcriptional regulator with XRE-family HTH domain
MGQANTRLAKERRAGKLTREKLCSLAQDDGHSLSCAALVQYERGERAPKLKLAIWLAKFFELTVEELFNGRQRDKDKDDGREGRASCA